MGRMFSGPGYPPQEEVYGSRLPAHGSMGHGQGWGGGKYKPRVGVGRGWGWGGWGRGRWGVGRGLVGVNWSVPIGSCLRTVLGVLLEPPTRSVTYLFRIRRVAVRHANSHTSLPDALGEMCRTFVYLDKYIYGCYYFVAV